MLGHVDEAVAGLDQPSMDGINTYFVSWAAREVGLKVALSGLGGDRGFRGLRKFRFFTAMLQRLTRLAWFVPRPLRLAFAPLLASLSTKYACHAMLQARPSPRG